MKITNESGRAIGGLYAQVGGDPSLGEGEVPIDCCNPGGDPPPDRAEDADVLTVNAPATGGIVQQKVGAFAIPGAALTLSFDATPTNGNTMVAFLFGTDTGGVIDTAGWSKIQEGTANGDHVEIWTKVAGAAEPTGVHVTAESGSNTTHRLVLFEVAGSTDTSGNEDDQAPTSPLTGPAVTAAGTGVLLSAFIGQVATYVGDPTWTPQGGLITDSFLRQSPGRLVSWVGHMSVVAGAYNPSLTTTGLYAGTLTANAAVIVGATPTAVEWNVPAPNTVDDDDATYQEIEGEDVLQIDLGGPFRIVRSRLLVGADDAGSRSYQIGGANEADFSDIVTVASISFDATGAFTPDDLDIVWTTDQSYRYFQLTGSDENRRVFSWELYEPDTSQGQDHNHDAIEAEIDVIAAQVDVLSDAVATLGALVLPTVVAVGTSASGTGDVTPGLPTGHTTDDILLLFVQTGNQAATAPAGYAKLGPFAGYGTAAAAGSTRLTVFWKRDGGSEVAPTVLDTGDHTLAQIMAVRGCPTTGDPFVNVGSTRKITASTTGTASGGATPVNQCLVVNAFSHGLDSATPVFSAFTNADLGSVTEQIDVATADGNGGGIGVCTGSMEVSGTFAATTVTETSTTDTSTTFVMLPAGIVGRGGLIDRQVFLTAGFADTWIKPTGAKIIRVQGIGGGSSGSAGRNAATASGGGGGGGGAYMEATVGAGLLAATATVGIAAGGAATANTDGAASNVGGISSFPNVITCNGGLAATGSGSGSGGIGGGGGGLGNPLGASAFSWTSQPPGPGAGGTTAGAGGYSLGMFNASGGSGAGGGTTQATSAGGSSLQSGAGGGGGRSNTNVGTGGSGVMLAAAVGGATAGANGGDSTLPEYGGGGGAGGTSAAGPGGRGGWPGGGGGGGGSQAGAQRGGAGGDGVLIVTTFCG